MGAFFTERLGKNEYQLGTSTLLPCIDIDHSSSLVRPLGIGTDWRHIILCWRESLIGSPATGNMTGCYYFAGLCAGAEKRFKQYSGTSHAIGFSYADFTSQTYTGTTNAGTDPANQNYYFSHTLWNSRLQNGTLTLGGGVNATLPRYETQWSSSTSYPTYPLAGEAYSFRAVSISKGSPNFTVQYFYFAAPGWNIPRSYYLNAVHGGAFGYSNLISKFVVELAGGGPYIGGPPASAIATDESTYGYFDSINFYWRSNGYPDAKLSIRDIVVLRIA